MSNKDLLPFIDNKDLYREVKKVLDVAQNAVAVTERNLYSNVVDPFSAVFDAMRQGVSLDRWLEQEKSRQMQKTLQNALGEFHQGIIGSMPGWKNLGTGLVIDVRNTGRKIIAEIKNKWNTTKGTDKKSIYDNLKSQLRKMEYSGFTGYYVEILPKSRTTYDSPFTPPDNVTHTKRPCNEKIRVIDGKSFYTLASRKPNAISRLYSVLPQVIGEILGISIKNIGEDPLFMRLFKRVY